MNSKPDQLQLSEYTTDNWSFTNCRDRPRMNESLIILFPVPARQNTYCRHSTRAISHNEPTQNSTTTSLAKKSDWTLLFALQRFNICPSLHSMSFGSRWSRSESLSTSSDRYDAGKSSSTLYWITCSWKSVRRILGGRGGCMWLSPLQYQRNSNSSAPFLHIHQFLDNGQKIELLRPDHVPCLRCHTIWPCPMRSHHADLTTRQICRFHRMLAWNLNRICVKNTRHERM